MPYPDDLLTQAAQLAAADLRRPRQSNLRRAVSAAYYALFHEIMQRAATSVLSGSAGQGAIGNRLRRTVQHKGVLSAAKWFVGTPGAMPLAIRAMRATKRDPLPPIDARLADVCRRFAELQEDRHRADYDLTVLFARDDVTRLIASATSAIATLRSLRADGDVTIFLLGCLLGDALSKNT